MTVCFRPYPICLKIGFTPSHNITRLFAIGSAAFALSCLATGVRAEPAKPAKSRAAAAKAPEKSLSASKLDGIAVAKATTPQVKTAKKDTNNAKDAVVKDDKDDAPAAAAAPADDDKDPNDTTYALTEKDPTGEHYTSIIVDASDYHVTPSMSPKICGADGGESVAQSAVH